MGLMTIVGNQEAQFGALSKKTQTGIIGIDSLSLKSNKSQQAVELEIKSKTLN